MATTQGTPGLHVKADNNGGWGIIGLVIAIMLAANFGAYMVHKSTYRHPTHPAATIPNTNAAAH
jgi:hypothetical protein